MRPAAVPFLHACGSGSTTIAHAVRTCAVRSERHHRRNTARRRRGTTHRRRGTAQLGTIRSAGAHLCPLCGPPPRLEPCGPLQERATVRTPPSSSRPCYPSGSFRAEASTSAAHRARPRGRRVAIDESARGGREARPDHALRTRMDPCGLRRTASGWAERSMIRTSGRDWSENKGPR
jgi:hypothetical protein